MSVFLHVIAGCVLTTLFIMTISRYQRYSSGQLITAVLTPILAEIQISIRIQFDCNPSMKVSLMNTLLMKYFQPIYNHLIKQLTIKSALTNPKGLFMPLMGYFLLADMINYYYPLGGFDGIVMILISTGIHVFISFWIHRSVIQDNIIHFCDLTDVYFDVAQAELTLIRHYRQSDLSLLEQYANQTLMRVGQPIERSRRDKIYQFVDYFIIAIPMITTVTSYLNLSVA